MLRCLEFAGFDFLSVMSSERLLCVVQTYQNR
jgi:hypothetical protein